MNLEDQKSEHDNKSKSNPSKRKFGIPRIKRGKGNFPIRSYTLPN